MDNLTKIKISRLLSSSNFWIAVVVYYLQSRGLSLEQVFGLTSFYALCNVLFEYPTGVLGDFISPRKVVIAGYFILAAAFLALGQQFSFVQYFFILIVAALGMSLVSGSDIALLHSVSTDFKKDLADINTLTLVWSVVLIALGSIIAKVDLTLPFLLTSLAFCLAGIFVLWSQNQNRPVRQGNILLRAKEGIDVFLGSKTIFLASVLGIITGTFFFSVKWIYNPLFATLRIDLGWWGLLISVATLFSAFGAKIFSKSPESNYLLPLLFLAFTIGLSGITSLPVLSLAGLFGFHIATGYIQTQNDVILNERTPDGLRASVLSFRNLWTRLGSSAYIFSLGFILKQWSFASLALITATAILVLGLFFNFWLQKNLKVKNS